MVEEVVVAEAAEEALAVGLREVAEGSLAALDQAHRLAAVLDRVLVHRSVAVLVQAQVPHSALAAERGPAQVLEPEAQQDLEPEATRDLELELAPVQELEREAQLHLAEDQGWDRVPRAVLEMLPQPGDSMLRARVSLEVSLACLRMKG